jgi:purine-binding chemotaxis protein CheW
MNHLLAFEIDNYQFGLHVPLVQRVIPACEITPVPDAPPAVMGLINIQGQVTPVLNTRKKLGLPERAIRITDYFVIASHDHFHLALHVDSVKGLLEYADEQIVAIDDVLAHKSAVSVVRIVDGLVLVYDPNRSLSETEQKHLAVALERARKPNDQGSR